jgi:hypothetical protein
MMGQTHSSSPKALQLKAQSPLQPDVSEDACDMLFISSKMIPIENFVLWGGGEGDGAALTKIGTLRGKVADTWVEVELTTSSEGLFLAFSLCAVLDEWLRVIHVSGLPRRGGVEEDMGG